MTAYICVTCGTQYPESNVPPLHCIICEDDRQYVGQQGQQWTTLDALRADHRVVIQEEEPKLIGIGTEPKFAIGQRALLLQRPEGNILWDCITMIDADTVEAIDRLGGISAIAISHPHFYSAMLEWSRAFGDVPIYIHEAEREWVVRPDAPVYFWSGEQFRLGDDVCLIRCGGHFPGSTALHWRDGADGKGALLTGDTINVVQDRRWVSFMYSFPNLVPLSAPEIERIVAAVEPFTFDRLYAAWFGSVVATDAKTAVQRSAQRYVGRVRGNFT
jgi:glyoxylase-like metal-dependent hydrolase (beta-lactamase superfamily II)